MPPRSACVGLLLFWAVASVGLITRDVLPELLIGPPPDLRSVASADRSAGPTRWLILVADDAAYQSFRSVGQAITEIKGDADGNLRLVGKAWFDSGKMLRTTPYASAEDVRVEMENDCEIDPSGNLLNFHAVVRSEGSESPLLKVDGVYKDHAIEVKVRGPLPLLNVPQTFPYEPKTLIQNALGPIDRLPGLAVGQRWDARVVSPLTGKIDVVRVEVLRKGEIFWDRGTVGVYEVVHKFPLAISARTWVRRSDGLVLRQEVPFPLVKLVLERQPPASSTKAGVGE